MTAEGIFKEVYHDKTQWSTSDQLNILWYSYAIEYLLCGP